MKFINTLNDIKVGYLYRVLDKEFDVLLLVFGEVLGSNKLMAEVIKQIDINTNTLEESDDDDDYSWDIGEGLVSPVQVDDELFNHQTSCAFYEIGPEDEHPELFL